MNYRTLGKIGYKVSEIGLGTWQVGGKWGSPFDHKLADDILNTAVDQGVNFIDTADVYETGLKAVEALEARFPGKAPLTQLALRWVLMFDAVSSVIPGASRPEQIQSNVEASDLPPLTVEEMAAVREVYYQYIAPQVHQRW